MIPKFIAFQFKKPSGLFGIFSSNLMVKRNQKNYDRLIKDLNLQSQDKILEIGYGPGVGIRMIAELNSSCTIHGIDFSKLMYKIATKNNKEYIDAGRMKLHYGDFLKTSALDNNYDKVFCLNVIYFWDELKSPFEKVLSLLRKGGTFHIYMADQNTLVKMKAPDSVFNKYSIGEVVEVLEAAGFESILHYSEKGLYIKATK